MDGDQIFSSVNNEIPVGCGCPACAGGLSLSEFLDSDPVGDPYGGPDSPTVAATKEEFSDYLLDGFWQDFGTRDRHWVQDTVTFSVSSEFTANQKAGFIRAFNTWSDVADIQFQEVASGGDINIVEGDDGRAWSGSSIYPSTGEIASNTISIDYSSGGFGSDNNELGNYALLTAIHEIGHSLGLGHTGDYNGSATYHGDAQWTNDTRQYSVMSYFSASYSGAYHMGEYASTPLVMDIYAIQQHYGANTTTRTGNTIYGFNTNTGLDHFNFAVNAEPVVAIWDAGGTDTIDLSGFSNTQMINLEAGSFSNVGGGTGNVAIAYGATIENAIGGSGTDTIYGNAAANILRGGNGNDTLHGSTGNDTLNGEDGTGDTVIYTSAIDNFVVQIIDSITATITDIVGSFGTDTLINIENFIFNGVTYNWTQFQQFGITPDTYLTRFYFGDDVWGNYSTDYGVETYTADDMGYTGQSGDILTYNRTVSGLTIGVNDTGEANSLQLQGKNNDDTFTVTGTHANLAVSFYGYDGDDEITISGVTGDDRLFGGDGDDIMRAGAGADVLQGQNGNDTLYGDAGEDWLLGGAGNDVLYGGADNDRLDGNDGNDTLHGGSGNDQLYGQAGDDIINGDDGNDIISGGDGIDIIDGGTGDDLIYGGAGDDIINGGNQNDRIYGESGNDTIYGGLGMDVINGGSGEDLIYGGESTDRIWGGSDNDTIYGEHGHDELYGEGGDDIIHGGDHNDYIHGGNGNDILNGDDGNDTIFGGWGNDTINGGNHDDTLYGQDGNDILNGGAGDDLINGGEGVDVIHGNEGDDTIWGGAGADEIYGDAGNDTIYAEHGDDTVDGGAGDDVISGGWGDDTLDGGADNDYLVGDNGNDTLRGGSGDDVLDGKNDNDELYGEEGNDVLYGGHGNDNLYGGAGNDTLVAGAGTDTLNGGAGYDRLYGGAGSDTFVFEAATALTQFDDIFNFNIAEDSIDISDVLNGFYTEGVDDITDFVYMQNQGSNTYMYLDQNGGGDSWALVARISGVSGITDEAQLVADGTVIV